MGGPIGTPVGFDPWDLRVLSEARVGAFVASDRAGTMVTRRVRAMGIRNKPIACGSPWQNCFAERLIGSIRRECLDHFVILGEAHLRWILAAYAGYCNVSRTHCSLDKDAPFSRPVPTLSTPNPGRLQVAPGSVTWPRLGAIEKPLERSEIFGVTTPTTRE